MSLVNFKYEFDIIKEVYDKFLSNEISKELENTTNDWIKYFENYFDKKNNIERINNIDASKISNYLKIDVDKPKNSFRIEERFVDSIFFNWPDDLEYPKYENRRLFKFEFECYSKRNENKYFDADLDYYFDQIKNHSKNNPKWLKTDWNAVCDTFISNNIGNYRKIQLQQTQQVTTTETPKHGYENLTFEEFNKFDKKQMITFLTTCKDAPKIIQKLNPELFCFFIFEPYINFVLSIRFERMYDGEIEKEMKKINPENDKWVNYNCIQFNEPLKDHIEKIKRAKKYEPYNGEYENVYPELTV